MSPIEVLWHLANFFAPAVCTAVIASALAKLLWRKRWQGVGWGRLCIWSGATSMAVLVAGLVVFDRDGRMATYAAMVAGCGVTLWAVGETRRRA